jgi:tetratricopeptide (TPR) repeat protein
MELSSETDTTFSGQARLLYAAFLEQHPTAPQADDAAYGSYALARRTGGSAEHVMLAREFLARHAESAHRETVLADLGFSAADAGDSLSARAAFGELLGRFPRSLSANRALLALGDLWIHSQEGDSAEACWGSVLRRSAVDPATVGAMSRLADLHRRAGRTSEAIALWERLSSEFYYTAAAAQARRSLPEAYIADGRYDEAIAAVESGGAADSLVVLATAYEKKGDRQRAVQYYTRSLLLDRKGAYAGRAFSSLGSLARGEGRTELAAAYFKQAAQLGGGAAVATADIADLLFETEQYADAARQYAQLAQAADSLSVKRRYAGRAIVATLRSDRLPEAEQQWGEYEKTFGGDPALEAEVQFETGSYYFRRQEYARARPSFERLAGSGSTFGPWGRYYLGKIAELNNKLDDAAKAYEELLDRFPSSDVVPRALLSLGNMYFNTERYEKAIGYYRQIVDAPLTAGDILPYAMNNLIEAYESTKLYDAALKTTQDFIQRFPNDEAILDKKIKLGTLYTKIGYYDQAVMQFQNLLSEAGSLLEAEIRYDIGEAYYAKGEFQQAILEFLKVPYLVARQGKVNWTATSLYMAGQAYEKMSKFDEAVGMYQQVIDRPGIDATFKAAARKEIDRVKKIMKKGSK